MLEGVRDVNWASLQHAFGSAGDVPDNLRALVSGDARAARVALQELGTSLLHQGSIYEATAAAVPFLAEIALEPSIPERIRVQVLVMLAAAANPYFFGDVERACRDAVSRALPQLERLLEEQTIVGLAAAEVFGMVPASQRPAPAPLLRLRDAVPGGSLRIALDIAIARIEGEDAQPYVEALSMIDLTFRGRREVWEDATSDQIERSAIDLVLESAISEELRRSRR
ncbi:MAG: hypothetical protein WEB06_11260 [Actinomycetota bacterium]